MYVQADRNQCMSVTITDAFILMISVKKLLSQKIIVNLFPVHDQEFLKKLGPEWYAKSFAAQPIGKFHCLSVCCTDSRRAVVSFWRRNVHNTG